MSFPYLHKVNPPPKLAHDNGTTTTTTYGILFLFTCNMSPLGVGEGERRGRRWTFLPPKESIKGGVEGVGGRRRRRAQQKLPLGDAKWSPSCLCLIFIQKGDTQNIGKRQCASSLSSPTPPPPPPPRAFPYRISNVAQTTFSLRHFPMGNHDDARLPALHVAQREILNR